MAFSSHSPLVPAPSSSKARLETRHMAISQDTREKKALKWPPARRVALPEKLSSGFADAPFYALGPLTTDVAPELRGGLREGANLPWLLHDSARRTGGR